MPTTFSGRQFNRYVGKAKIAAKSGPVFIENRGKVVYVLLTFEEYERLSRSGPCIAELLAVPGDNVEHDAVVRAGKLYRPAIFD